MSPRRASLALDQAIRLFTILHLTASRRHGSCLGREQLARSCDCSLKTIGRDIADLRLAGIPLDYDEQERTYCLPDKNWAFSLLTMTQGDALTLGLLQGLLTSDATLLPLLAQLHTTLEKATLGLPPSLRLLKDAAAGALKEVGGMARDYSRAPLGTLLLATARKETVEMLYSSRNSRTCRRREVDPYRLDRREGRYLEMQAWCPSNNKVCTFALNRVLEVRLTGKTFIERAWDKSDEGVVGGLRGDPFVSVEVCFDEVAAPFAKERNWPFQTSFEEQADGGIILRGQVQGVEGIVRELLSWRRHAKVLGGPELRQRMEEEVSAMAALYAIPDEKVR